MRSFYVICYVRESILECFVIIFILFYLRNMNVEVPTSDGSVVVLVVVVAVAVVVIIFWLSCLAAS